MAKTATLYNDFNTSLSPTFTTHAGTPAVTGGNLVLASGDKVKTVATNWDLTSSSLRVSLPGFASFEGFYLVVDSGSGNRITLNCHWNGWRAGLITATADPTTYGTLSSSFTQRQYGHLREAGGTIYFGYSSDGVTVTEWYSDNSSFGTPSSCTIYLISDATTVSVDEIGVAVAPVTVRRASPRIIGTAPRPRRRVPRPSAILAGAPLTVGPTISVDPTPVRFHPTMGPPIRFNPTKGAPVRFNPTFTP